MFMNSRMSYGNVAKFFHWLIAFLIFCMILLGFLMVGKKLTNIHQLTGLTIFTLTACRLIWKLCNPTVKLPDTVSKLEKIAAHTVQILLYVCMFGMPLSGWAMSTAFDLVPHIGSLHFPMPGINIDEAQGNFFQDIHNTLAWVLIILIGLHTGGAFKHTFIDKDPQVIKSMLPSFINKWFFTAKEKNI